MLSSARVKKLSLSRVLDRYLDTVSVHKRGKLRNLGCLVILTYSWASDPCAPSLARVRKKPGGGSFTTISEVMIEWRA